MTQAASTAAVQDPALRFRRILLKLSGEALLGDRSYGVDPEFCAFIAKQVGEVHRLGVQVGIVVGGGNIFRGMAAAAKGMDRATGDYIGMLATVMNGLAPLYVDQASIPAEALEAKQAELLKDESVQKKPENIRPQIVEGQLKKWYSQVCLVDQPFRDEERTVGDLITEKIATIGENIRVRRFVRYALGEEL